MREEDAAQVKRGLADVYLWKDGAYHVAEMRLKDFYLCAGAHEEVGNPIGFCRVTQPSDHDKAGRFKQRDRSAG